MSHELKTGGDRGYLRIATEEAFATREQVDAYLRMLRDGTADKGMTSLWGFYGQSPSARTVQVMERLLDVGERRIADMDAHGIDKAILALTAPGVQPLHDLDEAKGIARRANDFLAERCAAYPDRFIGMTAVAPQDPHWSAEEIRRGARELDFKGVQINSHTQGEYLDEAKFDPIFRALAETGQPLYIHPSTPPDSMIGPMLEAGLDGAVFGFGVDTGMHLLRLITTGIFDRYPDLQIMVGHMGEALPYWLYRLDYMHQAGVRSQRYERLKPLKKTIAEYMRSNVLITNSGVAWEPAVRFAQQVVGEDRIMYAMDYPYQVEEAEVRAMDNLDIAPEVKKKFFQTNAERWFKL
ncbi:MULTISPECIES: amidohydrolase family protein [unclassified Novosphingobium]|uniref:amidohydrolase family protein n=1 Tax=unclassified Novosphingobium TaxID=2644732 RepID=UPI00086E2F02|nr:MULTISPECIES: amidohydrolase family protein [unclassified Novosphingobium]MBN9146410.1 amidohydrolase [Novosphingobium sp.]MDR6708352.1 2,3-dihydroxybenzoate decarboxylase [Novosphingobium sp. 1748]ODU80160.1 MAG: amidohydrolase [Novosphingobium sp. SCN 63-17]OJX94898.1 MAG: amidohydrolase [Novosphingobium sp. 63-713]